MQQNTSTSMNETKEGRGILGSTPNDCVERESGEVYKSLSILEEKIQVLTDCVKILNHCVQPVCKQDTLDGGSNAESAKYHSGVPIADKVREIIVRVDLIQTIVDSTQNNISI